MKSVKKTALYDGEEPILHLYYGNDTGDVSRLITCFPMKHSGRKARKGTGQVCTVALSIPEGSARFWERHLESRGFAVHVAERFGERLVAFHHPCGIEYELIEAKGDARKPYSNGAVPQEHGLRGTYGVVVSVRDADNSEEFMQGGWNGRRLRRPMASTCATRWARAAAAPSWNFASNRMWPAGSWTYGEGVPHHVAFEVADHEAQSKVKFHLEGLGFTDVSEMKDRGYFDSVYVRTPGGALFEATVSKPQGFLVDEPYEKLGRRCRFHRSSPAVARSCWRRSSRSDIDVTAGGGM